MCPQSRTGEGAGQGMRILGNENRSQLLCTKAAPQFLLSDQEARAIILEQVKSIRTRWDAICDEARLSVTDRAFVPSCMAGNSSILMRSMTLLKKSDQPADSETLSHSSRSSCRDCSARSLSVRVNRIRAGKITRAPLLDILLSSVLRFNVPAQILQPVVQPVIGLPTAYYQVLSGIYKFLVDLISY